MNTFRTGQTQLTIRHVIGKYPFQANKLVNFMDCIDKLECTTKDPADMCFVEDYENSEWFTEKVKQHGVCVIEGQPYTDAIKAIATLVIQMVLYCALISKELFPRKHGKCCLTMPVSRLISKSQMPKTHKITYQLLTNLSDMSQDTSWK